MSADNKKRRKAAEFTSPGYEFQGMAPYYRAATAMMQRRSTRTPQQASEAIEQRPARRVHFSPTPDGGPTSVNDASHGQPDPLPSTTTHEVPWILEKYAYKEYKRLPQSFPHGLPSSNLEPGTTDQQYPPSNLFPEPPMGDNEEQLRETPLLEVAHLRDVTTSYNNWWVNSQPVCGGRQPMRRIFFLNNTFQQTKRTRYQPSQ